MTAIAPETVPETMTDDRPPLWQRLLFLVPVIGWIARDIAKDESNVWWAVGLWVSFWGCSTMLFGLPGLILPALFMTFMMFVFLITITRG